MAETTSADPVAELLAQFPIVARFATFLESARLTGKYAKRLDALTVTLTVDVSTVAALARRRWSTAQLLPPELAALISEEVDFQINANPPWMPVCVTVPEDATMPGAARNPAKEVDHA